MKLPTKEKDAPLASIYAAILELSKSEKALTGKCRCFTFLALVLLYKNAF